MDPQNEMALQDLDGEVPNQDLRRSGSWKKFKNQVKQTVQGWVSGGSSAQTSMPNPGAPSAVFPSRDVKKASIDVNSVLNESNCYSYAPLNPEDLFPPTDGAVEGEVPMIVVTPEIVGAPMRPTRRSSSSLKARPPPSSSVDMPGRSAEIGMRMGAYTPPKPSPGSPPTTTLGARPLAPVIQEHRAVEAPVEKVKCDLAVMKIKQAILSAHITSKDDSELLSPRKNPTERRLSDSAAAAAARSNPPSPRSAGVSSSNTLDPLDSHNASVLVRRKSTSEATGQPKVSKPVSRSSSMNRAHSMKKAKNKPMIWEHFDPLPNTTQTARCRACKMNVSCKFNTGNFVRHLQLAHQDVYRQYQNKMEANWTRSMLERNLKQ